MQPYVVPLEHLGITDIETVGGKNASLGEMISNLSSAGVAVPGGFATTAQAYREFLQQDGLADRIDELLSGLDVDDIQKLTATGAQIRAWLMDASLPPAVQKHIVSAWEEMSSGQGENFSVAVRSSATAEDLPDASFAGQQETFLNVRGLDQLLQAIQKVFASLYTDRAIAYRVHQGFDHRDVALSVGVQRMVRSDLACSGVLFTLDPDSGFRDVVFITASWGLGECVVQGAVNPDEFYVYKPSLRAGHKSIIRRNLGGKAIKMVYDENPASEEFVKTVDVEERDSRAYCLSDEDTEMLARYALSVEEHYGRPMDIEWAKDGVDGKLYLLQARPETVQSRTGPSIKQFTLRNTSAVITQGSAIGQRIGSGVTRVIERVEDMDRVQQGDVLVADMTDPDWEPVMKRASAIVTNRGGRTCHAAIIARELGVPAVVGCGTATHDISDGQAVTVSCAEGEEGFVYEGQLDFDEQLIKIDELPEIPVKIMMNVGNPDQALNHANIPHRGVGLARLEFIINKMIGVHPRALLEFESLNKDLQATISQQMAGHNDPVEFFVDKLSEGVAFIAAAFAPEPVIVRLSDFKSNEYANLIGGSEYEPDEENPMLGFRGASRYVSPDFQACFELECRALKRVRDDMGLTNVQIMVPFVRTVAEAESVIRLMEENGLKRGSNGLKVIMMCELPTNALLAARYLEHFDGMSIGSNDMTQLTLGLDRDSGLVADLFDERDDAVKALLKMAIDACVSQDKYIGICGQGPSDHPELAEWLMAQKIESMSLNPDSVVETWMHLAGKKI